MESREYRRRFKYGKGGVVERPPATQRLNGKWCTLVDRVFEALPVLEEFTLEVWGHIPLVFAREGTARRESTGRPSPWDSGYMQTENVWDDLSCIDGRA